MGLFCNQINDGISLKSEQSYKRMLQISSIMNDQPSPCIFTYETWSPCSASCWDGSSNYPQMQRYVNKSSIVQARGGDKPDCPDDLESRVDLAPCNTFRSSL